MKLAERELSDLDCVAGITTLPMFSDLKCVNWQRHPFSGLNTAMVRTWCGPDGRRNAKNLARVPATTAGGSSRFPRQKNLRENLPAYAFRTGLTVEPNSSQSQKAN